ncbi:hypothetical protein [Flavobacterium sp.]|uniref:hypothetical protein n=1 Tax=Flavobacterium sp. TaxID=239 RepID=UPI002ED2BE35
MTTAITHAVSKRYIPKWIELDFSNNSNLKTDIQNRISDNIQTTFINALNNMEGDNKSGNGCPFSEVTLLAMAYFYSEIFKDKIQDNYYKLEVVKGFLDTNNLTRYTAIHEIDVKYYKLNDASLFKHCWLIIQTAWFINSEYFGHHQHIDYVNHYIKTGDKLPIQHYNYDQIYLNKKYDEIDQKRDKGIPVNGYNLVSQWYYSILFLICRELNLSAKNFNLTNKDNREFNPLTKTSRQLRSLMPFKIIECDIQSAFPTFIDLEIGSDLKNEIYNNLVKAKKISRSEAKILFNTICNSGKYKSKEETKQFFIECGYNTNQCQSLIHLTHNPKIKFYSFMTNHEIKAIQKFINDNNLQRATRLHDAIIFIDDRIKPSILNPYSNCSFGYKELNRIVCKESFSLSNRRLPYAYIGSIPKELNIITLQESAKPELKGIANGFMFYKNKYKYVSATFNINDYQIDYNDLKNRIKTMLSTLCFLNKKKVKKEQIYLILQHIRVNSQYVFNVRALYFIAIKFQHQESLIIEKERNYNTIQHLVFKKNIDFLKARNEAEKVVNNKNNYYDLFCLLEDRITNNDFGYVDNAIVTGHRKNNLLIHAVIRKFNFLCTGQIRKERKLIKNEPLYISPIKRLLFKALSLKPQQQSAFIQKGCISYERELKRFSRLVNNRVIAIQLFLIICAITGQKSDLLANLEIQNQLKFELVQEIFKYNLNCIEAGVICFDYEFKPNSDNAIPVISDLENIFDSDLSNSIFNHISIEDAYCRGDMFFSEYLKFHNTEETKIDFSKPKTTQPFLQLPEFDFDL